MVSLELVPRDLESLLVEAQKCLGLWGVDRINIPDVRRLQIRSHEAASFLLDHGIKAIPHLRTRDRSLIASLEIVEQLVSHGLQEILLVSGDEIDSISSFDVSPIQLVQAIKSKFPQIRVYGALEPYRQNLLTELKYAQEKLAAGMDALLSQPFFDLHLLKFWCQFFQPGQLWVGIAPVTTPKSMEYWQNINKVPFAKTLDFSTHGNAQLGHELISAAKELGQFAYLMPIRLDAQEYLHSLQQIGPIF